MINQPYGIIYVTGPTGSGKTTTLYSSLNEINSPEVNISTAEDPIEYDLAGLCQVQTHKDIGLDFARILRAFLRQDPDVILVGETRDQETAKISVEAALTGHLVFTTLHTNDGPSSFTRLQEMGIEPFLMANSTIGIICSAARPPYLPDLQAAGGSRRDNAGLLWVHARQRPRRSLKGRVATGAAVQATRDVWVSTNCSP